MKTSKSARRRISQKNLRKIGESLKSNYKGCSYKINETQKALVQGIDWKTLIKLN